jgi:hypothetical protein
MYKDLLKIFGVYILTISLIAFIIFFLFRPAFGEETEADGTATQPDAQLMELIDGKRFEVIIDRQDYEITFKVSFPEMQRGIALMQWASWKGNVRLNHSQIYYFEIAGGIVTLEGTDLMLGFDGRMIVLCPEYLELIPLD